MATCPECDAELDVDDFDVDKGDVISCPECGSNLEVIALSPLDVEVVSEDDEDDEEGVDEEGEEETDEDEREDWEE